MRDIGPTFVTRAKDGARAALDWTFNGWGAQEWARWEHDARSGGEVAALAGVPAYRTGRVNEGGGAHVGGGGTVWLPGASRAGPP
ncbi:agmatine deiminase family protein [Streptomyces albidoflavus]|uniref:agmatine deiminase family protein n=1 Tax=Streptomyces albidoflavus TaxID=1886 RepID=UPI00211CD195|nr:agmatine deiminase family protein [Streptomyces albidoflavus]